MPYARVGFGRKTAPIGTTYIVGIPNPEQLRVGRIACGHNLSHNKPNLDQGGAICELPLEPVLGTRPCRVHVTLLKLGGYLPLENVEIAETTSAERRSRAQYFVATPRKEAPHLETTMSVEHFRLVPVLAVWDDVWELQKAAFRASL